MNHISSDTQTAPVLTSTPDGHLSIVPMENMKEFGQKVNDYLVEWRRDRVLNSAIPNMDGYASPSYIVNTAVPRFTSGEGKAVINDSIRGNDIYILCDVNNYSLTYRMGPYQNTMSPDDHFQDLKRIIAAIGHGGRRVNVIMPYLYEARQQTRKGRESLDCANALQELVNMGVANIITFDAHDPRVENSIPLNGFLNFMPTYQFIKNILRNVPDMQVNANNLMAISPDEGGMRRAIYLANVLGIDMGMFYKRRDYSAPGNPIVEYEFLGSSVEGKDMIVLDDLISSGDTMLQIARLLKERKARRIFFCATFGIFTGGLEKFDKAYEEGLFDKILTTNLIYQKPELFDKPYYISCEMSKFVALIIDTLNHDGSVRNLLNPIDRIHAVVDKYKNHEPI